MIELLTEEENSAIEDFCTPKDYDGCFPNDCGPVNGCGPYCYP